MKTRHQAGFTLMEIMIAIAIVTIVVTIAYPMFLRVRMGSNEAAAQKGLMTFRDAFVNYQLANINFSYPNALADLSGFTDEQLVRGNRNGYQFTISDVTPTTYRVTASPEQPGQTGERVFVLDQTGLITNGVLRDLNLQDDYKGLSSREVSRDYDGLRWEGDNLTIFWKYTNLLDRTLQGVIVTIDNIRFGGIAALGTSLLVPDGEIKKSKNSEKTVGYYEVGDLKAGTSARIGETVQIENSRRGGWWYSRSIRPFEQTTSAAG